MIEVRSPGASLLDPAASGVVPKVSEPLLSADTLDISPSGAADALNADFHRVGFIEGSRPHIASETANLLRGRLRASAGVLGLGFGLFFVYRLLSGEGPGGADNFTFYFHFGVTVVLISSFFLLCRRCEISLKVLRSYELAIFGLLGRVFLGLRLQAADHARQAELFARSAGAVDRHRLYLCDVHSQHVALRGGGDRRHLLRRRRCWSLICG